MRAFIFGGTGLIGYHTAKEMLARGHEVYSIGLDNLPKNSSLTKKINYTQGNIEDMSNSEIIKLIKGADWVVYACSTNALELVKAPAEEFYKVHNILTTERILKLAKEAQVKKVVLISNAYEYFNTNLNNLRLEKHHPYIKATLEQENVARKYNTTSFNVIILQASQIWGYVPDRKPIQYENIMEMYRSNDFSAFKGSIPTITARQVAQAVCGALEKLNHGDTIAIAGDNLKYKEINELIMEALNMKPYVPNVKTLLYIISERRKKKVYKKMGLEEGIDPTKIIDFRKLDALIDPQIAVKTLGMQLEDVRSEIINTTKYVLEYAKQHKQI